MTRINEPSSRLHVVFGSGGTKAILGGSGAIAAFEVAGLREWASIGSASGGSFPAAFLASGKPTAEVLRNVVDTDFSKLLRPKTGLLRRLLALVLKYRYEITRPHLGVYSSAPLSSFVEQEVGEWPRAFWTVAAGRRYIYLFTEKGVMREVNGKLENVSNLPVRASFAIAATCAVPGFIDGVRYRGDLLHDGALGPDGECPAGIAVRHFGAQRDRILAFDVGEELIKSKRWLRFLWQVGCMGACASFAGIHLKPDDGYLAIQPKITGFHGLQFDLTTEQKWNAISTGFTATAAVLAQNGLVTGENAAALARIADKIDEIKNFADGDDFVREIEELFAQNHLFVPREDRR